MRLLRLLLLVPCANSLSITSRRLRTVTVKSLFSFSSSSSSSSSSPPPSSSTITTTLFSSTTSSTSSPGLIPREKIIQPPNIWEYNFGLQSPSISLPHSIDPRVTPPETFPITPEQIATLERDGVVQIPSVFDEEWVTYLRAATAAQVTSPHFWSFAGVASKLYDYIQRNVWQTNSAFANFYYHSAAGDVLRQLGRTDKIRLSTDLLMVNPNKGFKWHQDNQNGPISPSEGLRFWITMDETPADYGSPVYLKASHGNTVIEPEAVFVDINTPGLEDYKKDLMEFRTKPGDMLIWHPKTIHKIDGPKDGIWTTYRRVLGGTVAIGDAKYCDKSGTGGVLSDLGKHTMVDGDVLDSAFFPIIYPRFSQSEAKDRDAGVVGRNPQDMVKKLGGLAGQAAGNKFLSFFQVLGSRDGDDGECGTDEGEEACKPSDPIERVMQDSKNDLERIIDRSKPKRSKN